MRLTSWTDYSLRVLMYCAACAQREHPPTISEIAGAHGISRSHLTKIVMTLAGLGLLGTTRGRGGGLRLLRPASEIGLGEVVRQTEAHLSLVECFDSAHNTCRLDGYCRLKGALRNALAAYLRELDSLTLADLVAPLPPAPDGLAGPTPPPLPGLAGLPVHMSAPPRLRKSSESR